MVGTRATLGGVIPPLSALRRLSSSVMLVATFTTTLR